MKETGFELAGAELDWPIGSAAGLANHPDVEMVASRIENLCEAGIAFVLAGSWTVGDERGGNANLKTAAGWDYLGGDEHVDIVLGAGYNAKGLPGPGTDIGMSRLDDLVELANGKGVELALSLSPHSGEPLDELKEIIALAQTALRKGVLYVEVNLSCPNLRDRPAFYKDLEGIIAFHGLLEQSDLLLNKHGRPAVYPKFGPFEADEFQPQIHLAYVNSIGGRVTSNTFGNQTPLLPSGEEAIKVNGGKAGMSGPALRKLGRDQLAMWATARDKDIQRGAESSELISVLGVASGAELKVRQDLGAAAVQLGSVLYWPELVNCNSPKEVVAKIKREYMMALETV